MAALLTPYYASCSPRRIRHSGGLQAAQLQRRDASRAGQMQKCLIAFHICDELRAPHWLPVMSCPPAMGLCIRASAGSMSRESVRLPTLPDLGYWLAQNKTCITTRY